MKSSLTCPSANASIRDSNAEHSACGTARTDMHPRLCRERRRSPTACSAAPSVEHTDTFNGADARLADVQVLIPSHRISCLLIGVHLRQKLRSSLASTCFPVTQGHAAQSCTAERAAEAVVGRGGRGGLYPGGSCPAAAGALLGGRPGGGRAAGAVDAGRAGPLRAHAAVPWRCCRCGDPTGGTTMPTGSRCRSPRSALTCRLCCPQLRREGHALQQRADVHMINGPKKPLSPPLASCFCRV